MSNPSTASLPLMLKSLRLSTIQQHWQSLADKAVAEQWRPEHYLSELCSQELASRESNRLQRYLKEATLPPGKQLGAFDFKAVKGVNQPQVLQSRGWVNRGENILLFGASGMQAKCSMYFFIINCLQNGIESMLVHESLKGL